MNNLAEQPLPFKVATQVITAHSVVYLNRLCRHFSHKVPSKWNDETGSIEFSIGVCHLNATTDALLIECFAPDQQQLLELMEVIKSHFDRFAQKHALTIDWPLAP